MINSASLKKISRLKTAFSTMDAVSSLAPVATYTGIALFDKEAVLLGILALLACVVTVVLMFIMNAIAKLKLRSPVWILILGLYLAIREKLLPLIIILAVSTALSDFVFHPMAKKYAAKLEEMKKEDSASEETAR